MKTDKSVGKTVCLYRSSIHTPRLYQPFLSVILTGASGRKKITPKIAIVVLYLQLQQGASFILFIFLTITNVRTFVLSRVPATGTIAIRDRMPAVACDWLD